MTDPLLPSPLRALVQRLDAHDSATAEHSRRVAELAGAAGHALGLSDRDNSIVFTTALLHDLNKLAVSPAVLNKPGALNAREHAALDRHPDAGADLLLSIDSALRHVAVAVRSHHERLDGSGYPLGLAGCAIPLVGRIVAVADVYDALVSERPYRWRSFTHDEACDHLETNAGRLFDPECVSVFVRVASGSDRDVHATGALISAMGGCRDHPSPSGQTRSTR